MRNKTDEYPDSVQLINTLIRVIPGTYLVLGSSNGIREGKERQGKVHETILEGLELLVTLNDLEQLQTHQADHCSCRRGDGRNDLSSNELALYEREKRINRTNILWQPLSMFQARAASTHLVSVCWRNVIILCPQIRCCHYEVHVEVCIIILNTYIKYINKHTTKNP